MISNQTKIEYAYSYFTNHYILLKYIYQKSLNNFAERGKFSAKKVASHRTLIYI